MYYKKRTTIEFLMCLGVFLYSCILIVMVTKKRLDTAKADVYYKKQYISNISSDFKELNIYVKSYLKDKFNYLGTHEFYYSIKIMVVPFLEKDDHFVGWCDYKNGLSKNNRVVLLNRKYWYELSEINKFSLMYHELGHCDLDLGHYKNGIMRSSLYAEGLIFWDIDVKLFFSRKKIRLRL